MSTGIAIAAVLVVLGGLAWVYLVPRERDRFTWVVWGWALLFAVNLVGLVLEVLGVRL